MLNKQNVWVIKKQINILAHMPAALQIVFDEKPAWVLVQVL